MQVGLNSASDDAAQSASVRTCLRILRTSCAALVGLGVVLPLAYDTAPFALYREALERGLGGAPDRSTLTLILGITGGSIAGKWLAHLALLGHLARGERWAWRASLLGLFAWLVLDSAVSLAHGAWWNVALVNVVPAALVGVPLLVLGGHARIETGAPGTPWGSPGGLAVLVAALGALTGVMIALGGTTVLFAPWRTGLADAFHGGTASPPAEQLVATFFGPIGGSTLGQFLMLGALARHRIAAGDVRALDWTLLSFLGWLVVDTSWSLASGGVFNLLLVNVPFALLSLPILVWARVRVAARAPRSARPA